MRSPFSCVRLSAALWTIARQAPLSVGVSRQEYWSGVPRPPPGDLPDLGTEAASLLSPEWAGGLFTTSTAWEEDGYGTYITSSSPAKPRWRESKPGLWGCQPTPTEKDGCHVPPDQERDLRPGSPTMGGGGQPSCQTRGRRSRTTGALGKRPESPPAPTTRHLQEQPGQEKTEELLLHLGAGTGHCLVFKSSLCLFGRKYRSLAKRDAGLGCAGGGGAVGAEGCVSSPALREAARPALLCSVLCGVFLFFQRD